MQNHKKQYQKGGFDIISLACTLLIAVVVLSAASYGVLAAGMLRGADGRTVSKEQDQQEEQQADTDASSEAPVSSEETSPETEAETPAETQPDVPPETAARDDLRTITSLTPAEVEEIRANYDGTVMGFGIDLNPEKDANNRPVQANDLLTRFADKDANVVCYCADENTPKVAFTFQVGMDTGYTAQVLDILDQYNIKSTFYITHYFAAKSSDLVKRMIASGHEIGSHSYLAPDVGIAYYELDEQMADAINLQNYVSTAFNYNMQKYNYNSGMWSEASVMMMAKMGYEVCFCSSNYADFDEAAEIDAAATLESLKSNLHNGCVYCFHMTNPVTVQILPELIDFCKEQGFTITQLN